MRHRDGKVFVRRQDGLRNCDARLLRLRICLDQRRKIGPGIAKQIVDPTVGQ